MHITCMSHVYIASLEDQIFADTCSYIAGCTINRVTCDQQTQLATARESPESNQIALDHHQLKRKLQLSTTNFVGMYIQPPT